MKTLSLKEVEATDKEVLVDGDRDGAVAKSTEMRLDVNTGVGSSGVCLEDDITGVVSTDNLFGTAEGAADSIDNLVGVWPAEALDSADM